MSAPAPIPVHVQISILAIITFSLTILSITAQGQTYTFEEFSEKMKAIIGVYSRLTAEVWNLPKISEDRVQEIIVSIWEACERMGCDPWLFAGIVARESEFRNRRGESGEVGYPQLTKATIEWAQTKTGMGIGLSPEQIIWRIDLQMVYGGAWLVNRIERYSILEGIQRYNGDGEGSRIYAHQVMGLAAAFRYANDPKLWLFY